MAGATGGIVVNDLGYRWVLTRQGNAVIVGDTPTAPDVTISGNSGGFVLLASRREDPDTLFFQRRLVVEGDTELGLHVKNLIDSIDLEELPEIFNQAIQFTADVLQELAR